VQKFNKTLRGYDPKEVNAFIDEVINQVEEMVSEIKEKEKEISSLKEQIKNYDQLENNLNNKMKEQKEIIDRYKSMELTLNQTIVTAQDSGEQIRRLAKQESDIIISDARKNSNRIVNDALIRAEKIEFEVDNLRKNMKVFKNKLRGILQSQLDMVDDIEILDI
jgi:cell division initiation protein